jgi:hypothetical protein
MKKQLRFQECVVDKDLYSTPEARLDTILGEVGFWAQMQRARTSEEGAKHCTTGADTIAWFRDTWGIQLLPSEDTIFGFQRRVDIVDEQKYMVFLLKWT